ncbi:hypothetical protein EC973_002072 [Apophysomyces ossiformis]|uniref:Uncharacterized protein n=1 Tax=Apophysomyces ossiformis TaxID=679940 RepID=A0A8H7BNE7_9FUNG|nr:hypothetical protein EC973_002072 [Apophysomyces ossiformis]
MISKTFNQQRSTFRPTKNSAFSDDDDDYSDDDSDDFCFMNDDISSYHSSQSAFGRHDDTLGLAQFLATTGPEEFMKRSRKGANKHHVHRASRLLQRLRKRPTMPSLKTTLTSSLESPSPGGRGTIASTERRTHIPLPVYQPPPTPAKSTYKSALRDSGVYSEVSEKDEDIPPVPAIASSSYNDLQFPLPPTLPAKSHARQQPRRPAPLPPAVASAAIAAACPDRRTLSTCSGYSSISSSNSTSPSSSSTLRSIPAAALKRRSIRMRHVQVQTEKGQPENDFSKEALGMASSGCCPHCRQIIPEKDVTDPRMPRRLSSPPAMASGQMLPPPACVPTQETQVKSDDAKVLLAMIEQLKSQLQEEQQSRRQLEQAMTRQQKTKSKIDLVAKEKDRWKGDCLWLQDRVALLPE